jgi:hypothetical protein
MFGVNKLSSPAEPLALGSNAPSADSASAPAPVVPDHVAKTTGADVANANPASTTCDKPVARQREIYSYIGDELIATWKLASGINDALCNGLFRCDG